MKTGGKELGSVLSLKQRIPKGEYLENFLKERGLWKKFRTSRARRLHNSETQALEIFVRNRGLEEEFYSFRDKRLVGIRLGDRAVDLE
ncbi:hypothetical protein AKJ38_00530 [candidate division MSBL1 archaeon SCGC-AAA259I14]|uniref:Uncharacterized protein n=2 Tax=candidate division MSBL1 TaxID=215777 RepID=A0A133UTZ9_9EURY|nr:hypothetical protein AKJ64_05135 [candidate division MSBL1 archaeon SCGC-AAA259E17]KXA97685.1 hypothetical protein AKJ38_00530 [candidate division MSBL1 archaeon SCGC-AAA259I14]